ncbi:MAG: DNA-directed RNA polymerase subunit omega [Candidatus Aminicenantes bacterium]|nr:DNA-directed RNA polymerase subunit omega [Candidatus Aminicenantes bacterium]
MDAFGNIDSKYRFIILAAKRAKQLLRGAKPKIQGKSKSLIRIAQAEVRAGLIEYEIIPTRMDDVPEREERVFVGGGVPDEAVESDGLTGKDVADEDVEVEPGEETDEEEGDAEEEDGIAKDDKDE